MTRQTWNFIDKSDWDRGEWDAEPDKVQWTDEKTGLTCLVRRGPSGALCGYVGVDAGHPWHGRNYATTDDCAAPWSCGHTPGSVTVHGGLTFSAPCDEKDPERGICHVPDPGQPDGLWWFGFDCAHTNDFTPAHAKHWRQVGLSIDSEVYRPLSYVEAECTSLASQIAAVGR